MASSSFNNEKQSLLKGTNVKTENVLREVLIQTEPSFITDPNAYKRPFVRAIDLFIF
eukprot:Pgem_evm1s1649